MIDELKHEEEETNEFDKWFQDFLDEDTSDDEPSDDDEVITVDESKPVLDTAWLIYESIVLAVPIRHVHQPGDCNVSMSEKLEELSAARSSGADASDDIDPRWKALLKLKSDKL